MNRHTLWTMIYAEVASCLFVVLPCAFLHAPVSAYIIGGFVVGTLVGWVRAIK